PGLVPEDGRTRDGDAERGGRRGVRRLLGPQLLRARRPHGGRQVEGHAGDAAGGLEVPGHPVLCAGCLPARLRRGLLRVPARLSRERFGGASPGARRHDGAEPRVRVERQGGPGLPVGHRRGAARPQRRREHRHLLVADPVHADGGSEQGSPPALRRRGLASGQPLHPRGPVSDRCGLGAGSKDGTYYAVAAGRGPGAGQLAWKTTTSVASAGGGFSGSTGFAAGRIFGTTFSGPGFETALDAFTGGLVWDAPDAASSLSPVGIVNGLVFAGENLGAFKARDVSNGLPLFTFNA